MNYSKDMLVSQTFSEPNKKFLKKEKKSQVKFNELGQSVEAQLNQSGSYILEEGINEAKEIA